MPDTAYVIHVEEMPDHPGAVYIGRAVPRKGLAEVVREEEDEDPVRTLGADPLGG